MARICNIETGEVHELPLVAKSGEDYLAEVMGNSLLTPSAQDGIRGVPRHQVILAPLLRDNGTDVRRDTRCTKST